MKKRIHYYLLVLPLLALIASCNQDVFDEYYARPEGLEAPIYQQLEARGNFKSLTALIAKAKYKDILSKSGYWTMMAPNDEAFAKFFQENGFADASKVDSITAAKIVRYALIYNAFRAEQLSDYQSGTGWVVDNAFRRRTAYYDGFQTKSINGVPTVVVGVNRNNGVYFPADNNNKYISYFDKEFFAAKALSSADYNFFFPSSTYTGFNVLKGSIKESDIIAENGVIQEVTEVSLPLVNLDQYLDSNPKYSKFNELFQKNLVAYSFSQSESDAYRNFTGKSERVYIKYNDFTLPFQLTNENFLKEADNDGQSDAYTLFAPDNASLQIFIDKILLKHFTMETLPKYVFQDLFKAHMVIGAVWPSKVGSFNNALDEELRFNLNTDVQEAKVLSNGFFYGTNKVQASNLFYSVYTSAYLDPKFTLATRLFNDGSSFREIISNINQRYTLFLPSDTVLRGLGFDYDVSRSEWRYTSPINGALITASNARSRLLRVLYNGIVATPNGELNNLSGSGVIRTGDEDIPGEYIRWSNNKIYAAGNEVLGNAVNIIGQEDQQNGRTYYIDNLLEFSEESPGVDLKALAAPVGSEFSNFYNYLLNSTLFTAVGDKIQGVDLGTSYTFVIPNNTAIVKAVKDGVLPGNVTTGVPNFNPASQGEKDLVADFIRYHILVTKTVSDDGLMGGQFETLRKDTKGEKTYVNVLSDTGVLTFIDKNKKSANYIPSKSNNLADRALIHLVDNYLLYTE